MGIVQEIEPITRVVTLFVLNWGTNHFAVLFLLNLSGKSLRICLNILPSCLSKLYLDIR